MPQLDASTFPGQIFWLFLSFIILYLLMSRVALPRITQVLEERQKKIDDNLDMAENFKAEAGADSEAYEKALGLSRDQARALIQEAAQRASEDGAERQAALAERVASQLKEADTRILEAKEEAMAGLRVEAGSVAELAVRRLIDVAPSDQSVASAIEAALGERS
jgi:F-type H+-transporting ATPase subunit b